MDWVEVESVWIMHIALLAYQMACIVLEFWLHVNGRN